MIETVMPYVALSLPEAEDLSVEAIDPHGELESANHLLDDHAALMRFHEEKGYLLLRGVLDPASVATARDAMLAVAARAGLVEEGAVVPLWTGVPAPVGDEENPAFSGIARALLDHPGNRAIMDKLLGEPAALVPIVQYRTYPPGGSITGVHQDGFYSPGIQNFKPVWMPLTECEREVGGLMLAVGQNRRGYFHNVAKPPRCPVAAGVIDPDSWASTDYHPGDVLVIHPATPHASQPNRSNRLRVTIDTRIQSAADPRVILGSVQDFGPDRIVLRDRAGTDHALTVDEDTFIRILHPGTRIPFGAFEKTVRLGTTLVAIFDGDRATTLRKASDN